jgi:hypothetical protein
MPKGRPDKGYALTPQREMVLRILVAAGGSIAHPLGLVVSEMRQQTGHETTQALSMVIKQLESAGLIVREVVGRRTYYIKIVESAIAPEDRARLGLKGPGRPRPVERPAVPVGVEIDYRRLADELVRSFLGLLGGGHGAAA